MKPHVSTICTVRDGLRVATLAKVDGNRAKQPVDHLDVAGQLIRDGLVQGRGLALDSWVFVVDTVGASAHDHTWTN